MSAAGEECSFGMDTDNWIECVVAPADSISKDINDKHDQTVGCANARAAHMSSSNSEDISDKDDDTFAEHVTPLDGNLMGGEGFSIGQQCYRKKSFINPFRNIQ